MAVVGNTGSGKSCTIAHLIQEAVKDIKNKRPKFFILDINGEYSSAFGMKHGNREPNKLYVNGKEFSIPLWLMNADEICNWLSATEQTQEPVLKSFWSLIKAGSESKRKFFYDIIEAQRFLKHITYLIKETDRYKGKNCWEAWNNFVPFIKGASNYDEIKDTLKELHDSFKDSKEKYDFLIQERKILTRLETVNEFLQKLNHDNDQGSFEQESADKPVHFPLLGVNANNYNWPYRNKQAWNEQLNGAMNNALKALAQEMGVAFSDHSNSIQHSNDGLHYTNNGYQDIMKKAITDAGLTVQQLQMPTRSMQNRSTP